MSEIPQPDRRQLPDRRKRREVGPKLACPACEEEVSVVIPDGRMGAADEAHERIYRRLRECRSCHTRFTTVERVERILKCTAA